MFVELVEAVEDYKFIYDLDDQRVESYDKEENIDTVSNDFNEGHVIPISVVSDSTEEGTSSNHFLAKIIQTECSKNDLSSENYNLENNEKYYIEAERDSVELDSDTVFFSSDADDDSLHNLEKKMKIVIQM